MVDFQGFWSLDLDHGFLLNSLQAARFFCNGRFQMDWTQQAHIPKHEFYHSAIIPGPLKSFNMLCSSYLEPNDVQSCQMFEFCTTRNRRATWTLHWKSRVSRRSYPERSALSGKPHHSNHSFFSKTLPIFIYMYIYIHWYIHWYIYNII